MDYDINDTAPEHKSGISSAARGEHDAFMAMFEEFKASNDERLAAVGRADLQVRHDVDEVGGGRDAGR